MSAKTNSFVIAVLIGMTVLLSSSGAARADDYKSCRASLKQWNRCQSDADCAVIPDVCGSMIAATNTAHRQEATDCNLKLGAEAGCPSVQQPQDLPPMKAVCVKAVCKTVSAVQ